MISRCATINVTHMERSYHTFYVWIQRLKHVPVLKQSYREALISGEPIVIINPSKPFTEEEIKETEKYLSDGGKLLVIDDQKYNKYEYSNQVVSKFGLRFIADDTINHPAKIFKHPNDTFYVSGSSSGSVSGGTPLLFEKGRVPDTRERNSYPMMSDMRNSELPPLDPNLHNNMLDGRQRMNPIQQDYSKIDTMRISPVLAFQNVGKGIIAIYSGSSLFCDKSMGTTAMMPSPNQKKISELEYWNIRDIIKVQSKK